MIAGSAFKFKEHLHNTLTARFWSLVSIELHPSLLLLFLRKKQEVDSRGSIIRNVGIKGNERHITNPTFREESRARICNTQAVLREKLSPRKLGGSNFPCLLQKLAGNSQSPKRALKFASSSHSRALDRTADGLI